ncbi:MAG: DUF362 domain-containing protein [Clostridiales bacterium]|nr:DUF362 domain-containing protein [Clostridiales bacterium]
MPKSKVYFTNMRTGARDNLPHKLKRLMEKAGLGSVDFNKKFVAIKVHFGEPGNLAYLRPQYARVVVDFVKARGGIPFLTDASTLYVGRRKHALEHIECAYFNGYTPFTTGCHIIIADGLRGTDEAYVPVKGDYVKEAKIGRALYDADIIISLSHCKMHLSSGIGGAMKNLGMGGGSRAGKMEMHSAGKPDVRAEKCIGCGACAKNCALDAITVADKKAHIDHAVCVGCGRCIGVCNYDAVEVGWNESEKVMNAKIAEYTLAMLQDKPNFHISMAIDISPNCDCFGHNDAPVVPDIGMFASFDPVAIDAACADAVNASPIARGSILDGAQTYGDHFSTIHKKTDWRAQIAHAEKIGLGSGEYDLITI